MVAADMLALAWSDHISSIFAVTTKNIGNLETYRAKRKADRTPEPFGTAGVGEPPVRGPAARGAAHPLRLSARARRRPEVLGRAEGPVAEPGRQAAGRPRRGSPGRVRELRGRYPARQLRRGRRHRLGPRPWIPLERLSTTGFAKGKLLFELRGHKLRGKWTLVKTKRGKDEWLLIKERDAYASEQGTDDYPHDSVHVGPHRRAARERRPARRRDRGATCARPAPSRATCSRRT